MSSETLQPEWDPELGVWLGNKAGVASSFPNPLYLFGYGSLLWRPDDLLGGLSSFPCTATSWKRLFIQRSCDHRGTTAFPGLVVTMIAEHDIDTIFEDVDKQNRYSGYLAGPSECVGLVWHVPANMATELIEALDFREKGGYSRHLIKVRIHVDTEHFAAGELVEALVYTGAISNPLFDFTTHVDDATAGSKCPSVNPAFPLFRHPNKAAEIITGAWGPSGPNKDYLLGLYNFLRQRDLSDAYIEHMAGDVLLRLGTWGSTRERTKYSTIAKTGSAAADATDNPSSPSPFSSLIGWGSNENGRLALNVAREMLWHATPLHRLADSQVHGAHGAEEQDSIPHREVAPVDHIVPPPLREVLDAHVLCGGRWSALLDWSRRRLTLWGLGPDVGALLRDLQSQGFELRGSDDVTTCHASFASSSFPPPPLPPLSLPPTAWALVTRLVVEGVRGAAMGHDHMLLLMDSGRVVGVGNNDHGQCGPQPQPQNACFGDEGVRVLKLAAGLRHSAAVCEEGWLYTWGSRAHAQTLDDSCGGFDADTGGGGDCNSEKGNEVRRWRPSNGAVVVDVACGAAHTVCVDSVGRVWTIGNNKFGALGRRVAKASDGMGVRMGMGAGAQSNNAKGREVDGVPGLVQGLDSTVRWLRVVSGWAHVCVRGVRIDGSIAVAAWGRNDFGQFPTPLSSFAPCPSPEGPVPLGPLPDGSQIREVWSGSEFTVVANVDGLLWACGWNEHGNLGVGESHTSGGAGAIAGAVVRNALEWVPVIGPEPNGDNPCNGEGAREQLRLGVVWEGALACGGSHCLCLPHSQSPFTAL